MTSLNYMNESSTRGIFLSIVLLFSIALVIIPSNAYAEEVDVKSFSFEETTIIEVTNDSDEEVNTFRIWLGSDSSFKSFKTEEGWVGEKTPQGVIIFTSSETIKPGESVKFGVKTDNEKPGINWKAVDKADEQMDTGKVLPGELPKVVQNTPPKQESTENTSPANTGAGISTESIFRIVPEKPNIGSSIRVTGDQFGASQEFDFYIDSKKIGSFETDENGHFMTTMKIPEEQKAERVDLKIKDKDGEEKSISIRIGDLGTLIPTSENIKLTIKGLPDVINRGDFLEIFGTGNPNSAITAKITSPDGEIINSRTAEIDAKGDWALDEPIIVALDAPFGKYSATITDGREEIVKHWTLESDKVIIIAPISLKIEPGEIMKFNGTAAPNKSIEMVLEDPLGKEIFADIIQTDSSGYVEFEFPTEQSTAEGTYTLIATQEKEKEFIFAGIGELPTIPVNLEFDKLNYKAGDTAIISLVGKGSEIVSLLVIDPSDKPKGDAISITLQPDGRGTYSLDLEGYGSGVYSAVISKGSTQNTEIFAVGLQTGSGEIEISTTKLEYLPSDSILILGDTGPNALLTVTLIDPDGNEVKVKETFSDKEGKISESSFRIPNDGKTGTWTINVKSGSNFETTEIEVLATLEEGMIISIEDGAEIPGFGKTITIRVTGAQQTVSIEITSEDGEIIGELSFPASAQGEINQPWIIPKDTEPGTYTIKASDAFDTAELIYELE
ncbi:MAG: biofilm-associated protein [Nitrosopumilus sp.]